MGPVSATDCPPSLGSVTAASAELFSHPPTGTSSSGVQERLSYTSPRLGHAPSGSAYRASLFSPNHSCPARQTPPLAAELTGAGIWGLTLPLLPPPSPAQLTEKAVHHLRDYLTRHLSAQNETQPVNCLLSAKV